LCRALAEFLRAVNDRGTIVFDGIGPPDKRELMGIGGLEIRFSGERADADTFIEGKLEQNTAPRRLMVVSSDWRLRNAATRRRAKSIPVDVFWSAMCKALDDRSKIVPEPREKQKGITESETDAWMRHFELDE
jgi:predicted RNA-binding protein with PIN domain